jgi:hypothetical protein
MLQYVSEKINEAMHLKKCLIWVRWEGITNEELMAFHGVILNTARHMKSMSKIFLPNNGFTLRTSYKVIFSRKRFLQL